MPTVKELYERGLRQRQAEEEARRRQERAMQEAADLERRRRDEKERRRQEEERRLELKRSQEKKEMLTRFNIQAELRELSHCVGGKVSSSGDDLQLIFNVRDNYESHVDVSAVYDERRQKAIGVSINGQLVATRDKALQTLADAAVSPREVYTGPSGPSSYSYSSCDTYGNCSGGC